MNNCREMQIFSGHHIPGPKRSVEALGDGQDDLPGSVRYEHDKKRENTGGYPPSGRKNPEQLCPVFPASRRQNETA
jgi:hypothetical protein